MTKREKAIDFHRQALKLHEDGQLPEAIALYQKASALVPGWAAPLYNLGLLFKHERKWVKSLMYNRLATTADAKDKAAWWNLGIAATALGRWQLARSAWRAFGIDVPDGSGPIDLPCGYGPIRLDPDGQAEVVWAQRIDPARAVLASIPFPESNHRWQDEVLNDGAPSGFRRYQGKEVPVFNALQLLRASPFGTYVAQVVVPRKRNYLAKLEEVATTMGGCAEDWTTSVRIICKACSEGRPHQTHDTRAAPADGVHLIGIAARNRKHATKILCAWELGRKDIHVESLNAALEAGPSR